MSHKVSRRLNKLIYGALAYSTTSLFFAPEMINPYYTTYILTHRFPNSNYTPTQNDVYIRKVWAKLADYGGSAYTYMRDSMVTPAGQVAVPVETVAPVTLVDTNPVLATAPVTQQTTQTTTTTSL